jgi:uncharacterized protein YrrD
MAHYGTLKQAPVAEGEDIRGSHLYGWNEERLGKIDDVIFDHSTGDIHYVVVDTGGWLHSKKTTMKPMSASARSGTFRRTTSRTWSRRVNGKDTRSDIARSGWRTR